MAACDARSIPQTVTSGAKDPEIAGWRKTGPVLGAHTPIHEQGRALDAFIDAEPPPVGRVEHLGLGGPHGTVPVRVFHPSKPREGAGVQVYAVDHKPAPEYQWPLQLEAGEFVVRQLFDHGAASTRAASRSVAIPPAATRPARSRRSSATRRPPRVRRTIPSAGG